jgi:hypothetical protein
LAAQLLIEDATMPKRLIDYDFTIVPDDQSTGLIEQTEDELLAAFAGLPWFDEICADEMVPSNQWEARSEKTKAAYRGTVARIYSQGRTSACVGFGTAQAVETTCTRRYGRKNWVPLAGMDVYSDIGRSLMSGAYIPDGIQRASEIGVLPLRDPATVGKFAVTFPGLEYKWNRPSGWELTAGHFRVTKAAKVQGKEMMVSAALKGRCIIVGRSRHCVPYVYYDYPNMAYANSWTPDWGDDGFGFDSERTFGGLVGYVPLEVAFRPSIELPPLAD